MSHTPVSQRLYQFVKKLSKCSQRRGIWFLLNIFEEGIVTVYRSYYNILIKQSAKMQNEEQHLFKASQKSPFLIMMFKFVFG